MKNLFVSEDQRRGIVRPTRLAWLSTGVVLVLAVVFVVFGIRQIRAGARMQPLATPTAAAAVVVTEVPTSAPTPTLEGCPTDRAQWQLVPYDLPGKDEGTVLYAVDPPCVMEQAEQAFRDYIDARAAAGRNWTREEQDQYLSPSGFTTILSGEWVGELLPDNPFPCVEGEWGDGEPDSSERYHVVFYTVSEDGLMADLLVIAGAKGVPFTGRVYECGTDEVLGETSGDGTEIGVMYQPVLYEDGRWRVSWAYDVFRQVPADEIDPQAMVALIRAAQGREGE